MNWFSRFRIWLASVIVVDVGRDNDGVDRPLFSSGTLIDKDWAELYSELNDAREAWRRNPMARRIVGMITSYVIGAGVRVSSDNVQLQKFIMEFWDHPRNRMDFRLNTWCDEMVRSGELFPVLHTNPVDGMSYVRAIPASQIEEVRWRDGDYEEELAYRETSGPGEDEKWWLSPLGDEVAGDKLKPWMLHYAVNRPVGAVRGESDLAAILVWLRRYTAWLEDRVRMNASARAFLWVVTAPKQMLTELRERYRRPPEPGTVVFAADGGERWEAVTPNLNARDASLDGRAIRWMIAAGGPGTSLVDFGEGADANLATARVAGEQRKRFLLRRQGYFCWMLADLTATAYNRYLDVRGLRWKRATVADVIVSRPDISTEDNNELAAAVGALVGSLQGLEGIVGDSEALRAFGLRLYVKFLGESITDKEFEQLLEGVRDESGKADGGGSTSGAGTGNSQPPLVD